jgi:hypothetical protein
MNWELAISNMLVSASDHLSIGKLRARTLSDQLVSESFGIHFGDSQPSVTPGQLSCQQKHTLDLVIQAFHSTASIAHDLCNCILYALYAKYSIETRAEFWLCNALTQLQTPQRVL